MRKRGPIVCKLRLPPPKGATNCARMRTIMTAALQRQYTYLQTELILWISLVHVYMHTYLYIILAFRYFIVVELKAILATLGKAGAVHAYELLTQRSNRSPTSDVFALTEHHC
jgi:hypothetical protein